MHITVSIHEKLFIDLTINSLKLFVVTAHAHLTFNVSSAHAHQWLFTALCLSPSTVRRLRCLQNICIFKLLFSVSAKSQTKM